MHGRIEPKPEPFHDDRKKSSGELTIITTHMNADFDAMASLLAAQKLYPGSSVVFPGSQEKNLRNFFVHSMVYLFNMVNIKDVDFSRVKRLVLVDTKQASRIGGFSELLEKNDLDIHIYDHHPPFSDDIKGNYEVVGQTGATVTILSEIIEERGIDITPEEATVMCLGIYEDTGSFSFSSTTERDFLAAAFLLKKGANIDIISNMITRDINPEQIVLLNDLIQSAVHYHIRGVDVVISIITTRDYVPDFAFLVQKIMKMENLTTFFAIARMGAKVYIVARSRISDVDVGDILKHFGGGGHSFAASASVKDMTLSQTEKELVEFLYKKVRSSMRAKDLMSSPAITVPGNLSCRDAREILIRYNINALPVMDGKNGEVTLTGIITRQIIAKTQYLKLENASVSEYMTPEVSTVSLDAELPEIQEKIINYKQRILPVVENGTIRGVITRNDLLNSLARHVQYPGNNSSGPGVDETNARTRNIRRIMQERIPEHLYTLMKTIGKTAEESDCKAYVVGGFVRDLFLYRKNEDIDIVIEGEGIVFAKKLAKIYHARVSAHEKFGTAVIVFPDGFKIDVASARIEHYRFPADLPIVEMSSIKIDLYRRDFTINTLAIQLNPGRFGTMIDFFAGQRDIKDKVIRVLHNLSFVEDPTRVFRAIRFEQRFGFTIGKLTSGLIENAVKLDLFKYLSGKRVFSELRLLLEEEDPLPAIKRLEDYGLLKIIFPSIKLNKRMKTVFESIKQVIAWHDLLFLDEEYQKWVVYMTALFMGYDRDQTLEICKKLDFPPRFHGFFLKERFAAGECLYHLSRKQRLRNSEIYSRLSGFSIEMILYIMASATKVKVKKRISRYFTRLRYVKTTISGKNLRELGVKPGPIYSQTLQAVLHKKLDNKLKTRKEEFEFAKKFLEKVGVWP